MYEDEDVLLLVLYPRMREYFTFVLVLHMRLLVGMSGLVPRQHQLKLRCMQNAEAGRQLLRNPTLASREV